MLDAFAWALIHFAWQGLIIGLVTEGGLFALRRAPAHVRYALASVSLASMLGCVMATTLWLMTEPTPAPRAVVGPLTIPSSWPLAVVVGWASGASWSGSRYVLAWFAIRRLTLRAIHAPPALEARFNQLAARLDVLGTRLRLVPGQVVPMAVGVLRPTVLLPASLLTSLTTDELESLLLHELAHVRRWDVLANAVQCVTESLLFYHPFVARISERIRHERELCCDEEVVVHCAPTIYARALASVEAARIEAVPAANGGDLMRRIMNLLERGDGPFRTPGLAMGLIIALIVGSTVSTLAIAQPPVPPMAELRPPPEVEEREVARKAEAHLERAMAAERAAAEARRAAEEARQAAEEARRALEEVLAERRGRARDYRGEGAKGDRIERDTTTTTREWTFDWTDGEADWSNFESAIEAWAHKWEGRIREGVEADLEALQHLRLPEVTLGEDSIVILDEDEVHVLEMLHNEDGGFVLRFNDGDDKTAR